VARTIENPLKEKGEGAKAGVVEMAHVYASTIPKGMAIAATGTIASSSTLVLLEVEAEEKGARARMISRRLRLLLSSPSREELKMSLNARRRKVQAKIISSGS
jgi:hypothetical protein